MTAKHSRPQAATATGQEDPTSLLKKISQRAGLISAIIALPLSVYNFGSDHLWYQRVLRGNVVAVNYGNIRGSPVTARILLVNAGKHDEVLFNAQLLFTDPNRPTIVGALRGNVGPVVLKPGEARVDSIVATLPGSEDLLGTDGASARDIRMSVIFTPVERDGTIPEDGKIVTFTDLHFKGPVLTGASPPAHTKAGLVSLLD